MKARFWNKAKQYTGHSHQSISDPVPGIVDEPMQMWSKAGHAVQMFDTQMMFDYKKNREIRGDKTESQQEE